MNAFNTISCGISNKNDYFCTDIITLTMELIVLISFIILFLASVIVFLIWYYYHGRLVREVTRAQKSERLKSIFLANVSHALRTPLNAIIGFSDIILKEKPSKLKEEDMIEMISHINRNGQHLLYFITQLLELSNYETNMPTFSMIEVNMAELMASYRREALRDAYPNVSVKIRTSLSPHCKGTLDTNLMHQLIMHLLTNAVQHTTEGSITIGYEHVRNGLEVTITDTGSGIPEKLKGNLFSMLHNEDALTLGNQAAGLGLSICKAIVDSLQGEISITSEEGKGTVAKYWLPCRMRDMDKDSL